MTSTHPVVELFGVRFAALTMDDTIELIAELAGRGRATGTTYQVATVNVDFLVNAEDDVRIGAIVRAADVCLADGMPIVWAARLFRTPLPERVAGSDLLPRLASESAGRRLRIHVFGAADEVAERARKLVAERYPDALMTFEAGPRLADPTVVPDSVLDTLAATRADVLCVALGNPKQERFIAAHRARLGIPVLIGIGGSVDMLVGQRSRAPQWVQRVGLEWVYRAAQEPARLGPRYVRDIRVFVPMLWREWQCRRARPG